MTDAFGVALTRRGVRPLVGDLRQLASVRRIVLDDGPERGVRALAFSTGGGLDFWVLADRSLDIGPLWSRGLPLAWQSPNGFRNPGLHDSGDEEGRGFNRSFSGLLVTCGLDHIRQPDGGHPLHGRLPFTPARLLAYGEDWERDEPVLFCEGEVIQAKLGGEAFRLKRRIEAPVGGSVIRIADEVENLSAEDRAQALLYHFNLGFPMIAPGGEVFLDGERLLGPLKPPDASAGVEVSCHPVNRRETATCVVSTPHPTGTGRIALALSFRTDTSPFLQIWRDLRPNAYVLGIEPCTSARTSEGASGPEPILKAGERRRYAVHLSISETESFPSPRGHGAQ